MQSIRATSSAAITPKGDLQASLLSPSSALPTAAMIYQEPVMQVFQSLAGLARQADMVRRAMVKRR
ncbi:MAG: hypothetical protein ACLS69_02840 [Butyricicoccus sp.]